MQTPHEIIFHNVDRSPWVENYILERMQRLEKFADGITSCRVSLTQEEASHQKATATA
jgi:ribosome-associated translation inhibitor RaiA